MLHREIRGVFKTTYAADMASTGADQECGFKTTLADMALYPLPIARWTVAALAVLFFCSPLTLHEYYLSIANLVWIAVVGALGLNILVGYTGQISIGHGAFMSVGAYTAANLANRLDSPWPVNAAGRRADGGADRRHRRHPVAAHQGALPGHRHPGRPAHHRVDHQPRDLHQRRRAGLHRGAAPAWGYRPRQPARDVLTSCWSSSCWPSWAR